MSIFRQQLLRSWKQFAGNTRHYGWHFLIFWLILNATTAIFFGVWDAPSIPHFRALSLPLISNKQLLAVSAFIHHYMDFQVFNLLIPAVLVVCSRYFKKKSLVRVAATLLIAGIISAIGVQAIKHVVGRPRPSVVQKGQAHAWELRGPTTKARYRSYPSGHSATAATACTVMALAFPRFALPLVLTALVVGVSRVIHNYHYPTDVVAGLSYGLAIGLLTCLPFGRFRKRANDRSPTSPHDGTTTPSKIHPQSTNPELSSPLVLPTRDVLSESPPQEKEISQ